MAKSTFKVLFYVNGSKEKNGIVPIMGRVTINHALDNIKAQIIKHYQRISDREAYVTAEMVRNAYQGIGSEYETLIRAFDKDCANFLKRVGKDRTIGTYKVMVRARNYVAAFIKSFYKRNDMSMLELTPDFIKEFAAYLTSERGLKNATIWLNCMWLKGVVMRAHYNGGEFRCHRKIAERLATTVYFADSYASWQKGAIENTNKLIRQYIPKGTDFNILTNEFIRKVQYKINRRPREKLNFYTPKECFFKLLA